MKWDTEIIAALRAAGRPMTTDELVIAIIGRPHREYSTVYNAVMRAARRGLINRPRHGLYALKEHDHEQATV